MLEKFSASHVFLLSFQSVKHGVQNRDKIFKEDDSERLGTKVRSFHFSRTHTVDAELAIRRKILSVAKNSTNDAN